MTSAGHDLVEWRLPDEERRVGRRVGTRTAIRSIQDLCDVEILGDRNAAPELLVEVPHGATRKRDFDAVRERLAGTLPDDLLSFFFVNTDVGAPECATELVRLVVEPDALVLDLVGSAGASTWLRSALVLRCLIPRTFADTNRVLDAPADMSAGITPCIPDYVQDPADRSALAALHTAYQDVARRAHLAVCGEKHGRAVLLHTYAPRTVRIDTIDSGIVEALRRAYAPGVYETWEPRPEVDVIAAATDGTDLAPRDVVDALRRTFGRAGVEVTENASYRLHPSTTGYGHATRHPGRVLCVEIRRDLLARPFTPFEEMRVEPAFARRMAAPLAAALLATDARTGSR